MAHTFSLFRVSTLAAIVVGFGFLPTQAEAGFEWKPGPKAGAPEAAVPANLDIPPLPPMPSEKVDSDALMKMSAPPMPPIPSAPLLSNDISAKPSLINMAPPPPRAGNALPDAVGFGSDLPLALGMRQIVPAQYAYAFDSGIDQGAKISWNGGKPWDMVLNDAVKPLGYNAVIEGNTVRILSGAASASLMRTEFAPTAPVAAPMAMHAGGDMPRPPLSPANTASVSSAQAPSANAGKPVHEVYIRRNHETDVGVAGKKAATRSEAGNGNGDENSGFWNSVNPMNWQSDTESKPTPYAVDRVAAGTVSTSKEVPPPPSYGALPDAGPVAVARMSANDARVDSSNEPIADARVPNAPDGISEVVPASGAPTDAPVMLTRGTKETSPSSPILTGEKDSVFNSNGSAPASGVLNATDIGMWEAKQGDSLKAVLQNWSERAQVQLYWVPAQDYKLQKPVHIQGNYTDALADVLGAYGDKGVRPVGRLHPNLPNGPSVLIIEPAASS